MHSNLFSLCLPLFFSTIKGTPWHPPGGVKLYVQRKKQKSGLLLRDGSLPLPKFILLFPLIALHNESSVFFQWPGWVIRHRLSQPTLMAHQPPALIKLAFLRRPVGNVSCTNLGPSLISHCDKSTEGINNL